MLKSEAAAYLAGVTQTEGAEASAPTNLHVITGEVGEASADGKTLVKIDGLMFSESDDQFIEVDALGGLEEGDIATIVLTGEQGHAMTPLALGSIGSVDRITVRIAAIEADYIKVEQLDAATARIGELEADHVSVDDLNAATARIGTLETTRATITDLEAATARIGTLEADHVSTDDFSAATARIGTLETNTADIGTIRANSAKVQNLTAAELEADHATVGSLSTNYAHITNGVIDNATIGYADVNNLSAHYAEIQNGKINSALIDTAAIVDEQVFTVTGNKATLAQIDASKINVLNLKAKDIEVERINGQPVTNKTLVDALSQHESDISDLDSKIDDEVEALNDRIDGAIETFTGTVVPTLENTPASQWNTVKLKDQHVGDVYYVVNSQSAQNGYCYRFTKSGSTYSWQLIKDSDVTAALSRLQTAEGKISNIETFDETVGSFMTNTDDEISSLKTKDTQLETSLGDKVSTSTFNTVSQKVDTNEANITSMSTVLTNNGLTSSTNITNTVNSVKQTADTNKASITSLTQTVNNKADGSTVTTLTQRTSTIEQNLNGITTRVSATESSISGHPDCWRIDRYSRPARVNTNNVVPVPDDFVEENFLDTRYRKESDMGTNLQIADYYIAKLTTYVHATEATTITDNFQHDDASAVYLNDEHIAEAAGTTVISVTLNLRAGWNKIRFLLNEQTGSDYARFATRISTWSNVDQQVADLNEYEGTIQEQRLSSAETSIEQNAEAITLRATKTEVQQVRPAYASSSTAAGTAAKVATIDPAVTGYALYKGASVAVTFSTANTAATPTLNLNSTGAKQIRSYTGAALSEAEYKWAAGSTIDLVYDGTYWRMQDSGAVKRVTAAEASISINAENIESKVSKNGVISSINQSAETVKIQASKVEIDGTAIFTAISSDVDDAITSKGYQTSSQVNSAITSKGYATTTQAQGYATTAKSEAISAAATDATSKADAAQTAATNAANTATDNKLKSYSTTAQANNLYDAKGAAAAAENNAKAYTDALEIGGRNLLLATPTSYKQTSYDAYTIPSSTSATELGAGTTLTIQFWDVELDSNSRGIGGYWGGGSSGNLFTVKPDADGYCSKTFTIPATTASHAQGANKFLALYNLDNGHSGMSLSIGRWKLEKGNKPTDWSPAPEDTPQYRVVTTSYSYTLAQWLTYAAEGYTSSWATGTYGQGVRAGDTVMLKGTNRDNGSAVYVLMTVNTLNTSGAIANATSHGLIDPTAGQRADSAQSTANAAAPKANAVKRTRRIWYRTNASSAPATPGTASSNWVTKADDGNDAWTKMHIAISSTHKYIYTCEQYEMANGTVGYTSVLLDNTITVIDGGNIITGSVTANKLNAANINASKSLTVGAMTDAAASTILNSNVVVGGRNLLRQSYYQQTTTTNGITCTNNGDGSVTINGTTTATPTIYCFNDSSESSRGHVTLEAGTYTLSGCPDGGGDGTWRLDMYGIPTSSGTAVAVDYGDGATFTTTGGTPTLIRMRFPSGITLNNFTVWPKLEKGNKATDWTPAPEDMATAESLAGTNESLEGAITDIGELSDQLVDTTTEQNKTITDIQKYLNSLRQDLDAEIQSRQQWLNFNAAEGLVIGAKNSTFKTVTTNTSQQFRSGGTVLAETSGSEFVAPIMRSDQILIGNWMWTRRDNGNLSLKWIG